MHAAEDKERHPETFRSRSTILTLGIIYGSLLTAVGVSIFFLDEPQKHGFKAEHSVAIVGGLVVAAASSYTLLCVYTSAAYLVERISIDDKSSVVRSVFQNWRFESWEIEQLIWRTYPRGGSILFRLANGKVKLSLDGFQRHDRLRIIELLRDVVAVDRQEGWPRFCQKFALPLREASVAREPKAGEVKVTKRRYDRLMIVVLPISISVAVAGWVWGLGPHLSGLPLLAIVAWLLLRYSVPQHGMVQPRLTSSPLGRTKLYASTVIVGSKLLILALAVSGIDRSERCGIAALFLLLAMPPLIWRLVQVDKLRKKEEDVAIKTAPQRWLAKSAFCGIDD